MRGRTRNNRQRQAQVVQVEAAGAVAGTGGDQMTLAMANALMAAAGARGGQQQQPDPALALGVTFNGRTEPGSLAGLTPAVLAQQLMEFHGGNYSNVARVWEVMERRDDAVVTAESKLRGKVLRRMRDWTIETADDSAPARRQAEWLRGFYNRLAAESAVNELVRGGVRQAAGFALDAYAKQYSFLAKGWSGRGADLALTLRHVPLWFFGRREGRWMFDVSGLGVPSAALDRRQWVVAAVEMARMEAASVLVLFKRLPMHQLVHVLEKWGVASVYGESPGAKGTDAWNAVFEAVQNIRAGFSAVIGSGAKLHTIEPRNATSNSMHRPWITDCSEGVTRIFLGGSLSTIAVGDTGALAGGAQADDMAELVDDLVDWIVEMFQEQVDPDALLFGLGAEKPLAWFSIPGRRGREGAERMTIYRQAADLGARVPARQLHDEFDLHVAQDGEELLVAPAATQQISGAMPPAAGGTRPPGTPERGGGSGADGAAAENIVAGEKLNGAQITAALTVLSGVTAGTTSPVVAQELLVAVGIAEDKVRRMVDAADKMPRLASTAGNAAGPGDAGIPAPKPEPLPAGWSAPLAAWFAALDTRLQGGGTGDATAVQAVRTALAALPQVLDDMDLAALADTLAAGMIDAAAAALEGAQSATGNAASRAAAVGNADTVLDFGPDPEALAKLLARVPVASPLRTAEWSAVPVALRERALFSAGVTSARMIADIGRRLDAALAQTVDGTGMDRDRFIRELRTVAVDEGLSDGGTGYGALTDIGSVRRLGLVFDVQTQQAAGYSAWRGGTDAAVIDAFPAQELLRVEARREERDWQARWSAAGGSFVAGGRMVALKGDPVWERISAFGVPWPPFDFGSGMGVQDVDRDEAEALGLIAAGAPAPDAQAGFNASLEAGVSGLGDELRQWLAQAFGGRAAIEGDTVRWREEGEA